MNTPFFELATQFRALEPEIEQAVARDPATLLEDPELLLPVDGGATID